MAGEDFGLAVPLAQRHAPGLLHTIVAHCRLQITTWNARLGEQLSILWLGLPKAFFAVVNTFCFFVLAYGITALALRSGRIGRRFVSAFTVALCVLYLLWPRFEVFFWETGGSEYLQPLACASVVLLPFVVEDLEPRLLGSGLRWTAMLVLGFVAGASFENLGPAMLLMMAIQLWRLRQDHVEISRRFGVFATYAMGWLALLLAPSTKVRAAFYREAYHIPPWSVTYLLRRGVNVAKAFVGADALPLLCLCALYVVLRRAGRKPRVDATDLLLLAAAAVSVCLVIPAPYTEPRAFQFFWAVVLAGVVRFTFDLLTPASARGFSMLSVGVPAVCMALFLLYAYWGFHERAEARSAFIAKNVDSPACRTGLPISRIQTIGGYRILNNREDWVMASLDQVSTFYGCKLVASAP